MIALFHGWISFLEDNNPLFRNQGGGFSSSANFPQSETGPGKGLFKAFCELAWGNMHRKWLNTALNHLLEHSIQGPGKGLLLTAVLVILTAQQIAAVGGPSFSIWRLRRPAFY